MSTISCVSTSKRIRIDPNIINTSKIDKNETEEVFEKVCCFYLVW